MGKFCLQFKRFGFFFLFLDVYCVNWKANCLSNCKQLINQQSINLLTLVLVFSFKWLLGSESVCNDDIQAFGSFKYWEKQKLVYNFNCKGLRLEW